MSEPTASMPPSTAVPPKVNNISAAPESQTTAKSKPTLQEIPDAMQVSDSSLRAEKDVASSYWTTYERVAKQHDDEFIERQNGDLDSLLIFVCLSAIISSVCTQRSDPLTSQAGLFSSVSSSFIVNMQSSLSPQPSDTTNALLKVLINKIDNGTFSQQEASLPMWTGPSSAIIWIQSLVYTSLSMSLLAAFGGVLGKQWLGHLKTSRFGHGTLHERCMRRQRKLDGLKTWHFNIIIAALPILLQLSLLFFGVAVAANIWTLQHTVSGVIMGATSFGLIFYAFTVVASLKSQDCPFQTPVSTILQRVLHAFRERIMVWARREIIRGVFKSGKDFISGIIARFSIYLSRIRSALWPRTLRPTHDLESAGSLDESVSFEVIGLEDLESPAGPAGARSIQWIITTSTDMDIITTAVQMVPDVEWPDRHDVTFVLDQLTSQLFAYVGSPWQITPHMRERVRTCLKAIFHLYIACDVMPNEQGFELISSVMDRPRDLDIASFPFSDRMWVAHILTYRLHNGDRHSSLLAFVHGVINKCLNDPKSPPRLVADCLLLAGLVVGLQPQRQHLAKIDKSAASGDLQDSVIDRILDLLLGASPGARRGYALEARKLLRTLGFSKHCQGYNGYRRSVQCLKLCFRLLEDQGIEGDQIHLIDVAAALRLSFLYSVMVEERKVWTYLYRESSDKLRVIWGGRPDWHTQAQFDLLVDYLLQVGQGADYTTIGDAFAALAGLRGSPSTLERKYLYIQTMIQFMKPEIPLHTRHAAMSAAYALRAEVASMDRGDEPLRYLFSRTLMSVMQVRDPTFQQHASTSVDDTPFSELSDMNLYRDRCYLGLLCALSKEATWHGHFYHHDHFKSCLAIAGTLSSRLRMLDFDRYLVVHVTHIIATIDALGEDHEFLRAIQMYQIWPLILHAWGEMFTESFFYDPTEENWEDLSSRGIVESLPCVAAYAKKHWEQWDNRAETHQLIQLVEQVCDKLNEEDRLREQGVARGEAGQENDTCGHRGIPSLSEEIREVIDVLRKYIFQ